MMRCGHGGRNDPFYFEVTQAGQAALKEQRIPAAAPAPSSTTA